MRVLSLFDGISCGRAALERARLPVSRYVAFETDQNAINCSNWNYPDTDHRGSVIGADFSEFIGFDLVMGGFSCQDLSTAGRQKGLKGRRSSLFWYLVDAIETVEPKYFLVENNYGMPEDAKRLITDTLGVEPIMINSALVSAQTRKRLYWTNIPNVEPPEDRGIFLRDVLGGAPYGVPTVVPCNKPASVAILDGKGRQGYRLYDINAKRTALLASSSGADGKNGLYAVALRTRDTPGGRYKRPEIRTDGKSNALTTVTTDSMVIRPSKIAPAYTVSNGLLSYRGREVPAKLPDGEYAIHRLSPEECERLQGLPDGYTEMLCKTQRYRALGNGWNVDTVAHIFSYINSLL